MSPKRTGKLYISAFIQNQWSKLYAAWKLAIKWENSDRKENTRKATHPVGQKKSTPYRQSDKLTPFAGIFWRILQAKISTVSGIITNWTWLQEMIVDLHLSNTDFTFGNLPEWYLGEYIDYEVCVSSIYVKLSKPVQNQFITLSSTLVDRSSFNPKQEILSFYTDKDEIIFHQPTHLSWYKIQCYRISDSVFKLQLEKPHENTKIEKLYLQLRIRKVCKGSVRH